MKGFVAISTVLILSVVLLVIVGTVTLTAIGEAQTSLTLFQGEDSISLVEGCVEDLLQKVHDDSTYSATTVSRPDGTSCTFFYNASGPTDWDVTISTNITTNPRRIKVAFTRSATAVLVSSWQEI